MFCVQLLLTDFLVHGYMNIITDALAVFYQTMVMWRDSNIYLRSAIYIAEVASHIQLLIKPATKMNLVFGCLHTHCGGQDKTNKSDQREGDKHHTNIDPKAQCIDYYFTFISQRKQMKDFSYYKQDCKLFMHMSK